MNEEQPGRVAGGVYTAAALALSAALAATGAAIVVIATRPAPLFELTPALWLGAAYLVMPMLLVLLSLGGGPRPATGVRKFVVAGLAADMPAAAVLIAAFPRSDQSWLPFVVVGGFAVIVLLVPSGRSFDAARAVSRGDRARALQEAGLSAYAIGIPAATVTGLAVPIALTGLQPCELCVQAFLGIVVLAGYAVPALVAALLAASARRWLAAGG